MFDSISENKARFDYIGQTENRLYIIAKNNGLGYNIIQKVGIFDSLIQN